MDVLYWFLDLLVTVKEKILSFEIPFLNVDYLTFSVCLIIVGMAMKVLLNYVNVSADSATKSFSRRKGKEKSK